jgi:hypothetical protein
LQYSKDLVILQQAQESGKHAGSLPILEVGLAAGQRLIFFLKFSAFRAN